MIAFLDKSLFAMQADIAHDLSDTILEGIEHDCCRRLCDCGLWTKTIGSYRHRNAMDHTVSYEDWLIGQMLGIEKGIWGGNINVLAGYLYGKGKLEDEISEACYNTYFGGLSFAKDVCGVCAGFTFVGGYVDWNQERRIMDNLAEGGVIIGKSDDGATFITSELALSKRFSACGSCLKASFFLRHAGLYFGDYIEEGYEEDFVVKDRNVDLLTTRLELAFPMKLNGYCVEAYVGAYGRYLLRGENVELEGFSGPFDTGSADNVAAGLFGVRNSNCVCGKEISIDLAYYFDSEHSQRVLGSLGIRF